MAGDRDRGGWGLRETGTEGYRDRGGQGPRGAGTEEAPSLEAAPRRLWS